MFNARIYKVDGGFGANLFVCFAVDSKGFEVAGTRCAERVADESIRKCQKRCECIEQAKRRGH